MRDKVRWGKYVIYLFAVLGILVVTGYVVSGLEKVSPVKLKEPVSGDPVLNFSGDVFKLVHQDDECLAECTSVMCIRPKSKITMSSDESLFNWTQVKLSANSRPIRFDSYSVLVKKNATVQRGVNCTTQKLGQFPNLSDSNVTVCSLNGLDNIVVEASQYVPIDITNTVLPAFEETCIKVVAYRKAKLGVDGVDWQAVVAGHEIKDWAWFNTSWKNRINVTITFNQSPASILNQTMEVVLNSTAIPFADTQACQSLRVVNDSDVSDAQIPYWFSECNQSRMRVYFKVTGNHSNNTQLNYSIYFNNSGAADQRCSGVGCFGEVFDYFADFENASSPTRITNSFVVGNGSVGGDPSVACHTCGRNSTWYLNFSAATDAHGQLYFDGANASSNYVIEWDMFDNYTDNASTNQVRMWGAAGTGDTDSNGCHSQTGVWGMDQNAGTFGVRASGCGNVQFFTRKRGWQTFRVAATNATAAKFYNGTLEVGSILQTGNHSGVGNPVNRFNGHTNNGAPDKAVIFMVVDNVRKWDIMPFTMPSLSLGPVDAAAAASVPNAEPNVSIPVKKLPANALFITTPNITAEFTLLDSGSSNKANVTARWYNTTSLVSTVTVLDVSNGSSVNVSLSNASYAFTNGIGNLTVEILATASNGSNSTRRNMSLVFVNDSLPSSVLGIDIPSNGNETSSPLLLQINASSDADGHTVRYFWFRNGSLIAETTDTNLTVSYAPGQFRRDFYNVSANDSFSGPVASGSTQNFLVNTMFPNPNQAGRNPALVVYNSTLVNVSFIVGFGANETNGTINITVFRNNSVWQSTIQNRNNATNVSIIPSLGVTKGDTVTIQSILRDAYNTNASNFTTYTINNSLPTAPLCALPNASLSNVNVSINITASTDNDTDAITYRAFVNTSVSLLINGSTTNTNWSFPGVAGTYFYQFQSDDGSGNITSPLVCTIHVKTAAPNITHQAIYSDGPGNVTINFTVNETHRLSGGSLGRICYSTNVTNISTCTNLSVYSDAGNRSIQLSGFNAGLLFFTVQVEDNVSNVANYSAPVNVSVQAAASGGSGGGGGGGSFSPQISVTDAVTGVTTFRVFPNGEVNTYRIILPFGSRTGEFPITATEEIVGCDGGPQFICSFSGASGKLALTSPDGGPVQQIVEGKVRVTAKSGQIAEIPITVRVIDLDQYVAVEKLPFTVTKGTISSWFVRFNPDGIPIGLNAVPLLAGVLVVVRLALLLLV